MNEELISQIVHRILSDPSLQGLLYGNSSTEGDRANKSEALVLLNYAPDFPRVLKSVRRRWGADYSLNILPSDQVYRVKPDLLAGMTWIGAEDALAKSDWKKLILPACSPNTLAKAALGIRDNPICEMIGRGISNGNSIELVTEYLGLNAQTPLAYRELYEGYIQKLQSYGVIVSATLEAGCPFSSIPASFEESTSPREEISFAKRFLGDKQAYGFPEESRILVRPGTVISPLARDTLKLRRIELCIEKEEGSR
ncbi:hypothetical protein [Desulfosporosinus youngiae]|uniref:Flavoprotein n=1 Tax=Desulfosporosinus youngiae DSM 17734 TaxID=768710 RepID=H5XTP2_9FIRM|nr:hypothetical protein [Desulfosporosinus youngiae]EHQ88775.1 hypothetical protein DesyoDRAFT_1646 [Desulfosporosinus youngiae DSM 17734]